MDGTNTITRYFVEIDSSNYVFQSYDETFMAGRVDVTGHRYYQGGNFYTFSAAPMFHSGDMVVSQGRLSGTTDVTLDGEAYRFGIPAFTNALEIEFHSNGRVKSAYFGLGNKRAHV